MTRRLISYVLPVFNEGGGIERFYGDLVRATNALDGRYDVEFWFVDDGSTDDSGDRLAAIVATDPRVRLLTLSRNFGHQIAITAGLDHADGDAVIVMDTDGQDPPEISLRLVEEWERGYAVVYGQRNARDESAFKRLTAHAFYRMLATLSDFEIPVDVGDFRLLDRRAVGELRRFRERNRFIRGMVASLGFRQTAVPFDRPARTSGATHYSVRKMWQLAVDGLTSFSMRPLELVFRLGLVVWLLSILGICYAVAMKFFLPNVTVSGWTLMIITILFIGGVQVMALGLIGLYVGRIYTQVQQRPLYIVEQELGSDRPEQVLTRGKREPRAAQSRLTASDHLEAAGAPVLPLRADRL